MGHARPLWWVGQPSRAARRVEQCGCPMRWFGLRALSGVSQIDPAARPMATRVHGQYLLGSQIPALAAGPGPNAVASPPRSISV
jgi:hypothetical protein